MFYRDVDFKTEKNGEVANVLSLLQAMTEQREDDQAEHVNIDSKEHLERHIYVFTTHARLCLPSKI